MSSLTSSWHMHSQHCGHEGENAARKCFFLRFLFCRHLGGKCAAAQMVQSNALHHICGFGLWGSDSSPQTLVPPHTTSTSPWKPKLGRTGGKHRVHGLQMSQKLQLLPHCHTWIMRSCHHQGALNTNAKAQGTAQTSVMCKYTNSYRQAHTYSLNDTENTCAVSLPYHKITLWSVQIQM